MHFHRRTRVGWRVLPVPSRPGTASDSLASLRCPWPWVALIASLWLSTQRQLSRWFLVWVTTRRVHTANLDKPCKQRKDSNYSQLFSNTTKHKAQFKIKWENGSGVGAICGLSKRISNLLWKVFQRLVPATRELLCVMIGSLNCPQPFILIFLRMTLVLYLP